MVGKSGRTLVVFDGYITSSTKDHCHSKRAPVQSLDHSVSLEKQVLCRKEVVLSNPQNKQEFITALTAALIDAGYYVLRSDTDADHDIVVKAIAELDTGLTVIVGDDTELLVLAIYYSTTIEFTIQTTSPQLFFQRALSLVSSGTTDLDLDTCLQYELCPIALSLLI